MHRNTFENELKEDAENPMKSRQNNINIMEQAVFIQLITAISTSLIALCGVFAAIFWGYIPRKKQEKINQLQKELYDCYCDIYNLLEIEKNYMEDAELSKIKTRENRRLSNRAKPSNVERRISELEKVNSK